MALVVFSLRQGHRFPDPGASFANQNQVGLPMVSDKVKTNGQISPDDYHRWIGCLCLQYSQNFLSGQACTLYVSSSTRGKPLGETASICFESIQGRAGKKEDEAGHPNPRCAHSEAQIEKAGG